MRITGKQFKKGLEHNAIVINNEYVAIHSSDGNVGVFRKEAYEQKKKADESSKFNLSSKDFNLISKFDELEVEVKDASILFKGDSSKFKIQNYDHSFTSPQRENSIDLKIDIESLKKAAQFSSSTKPAIAGVLIYPDCIVGTSSVIFYRLKVNTNIELSHIPINFLKILDGNDYELSINDRFVLAKKPGEIAYSALYEEKLVELNNREFLTEGKINLDCRELKKQLVFCENFSKLVTLEIKEDTLTIQSYIDDGQYKDFTSKFKLEECNVLEYRKTFSITNLLKILNAIESDILEISNNYIVLQSNNELAVTMIYSTPGEIDLKNKEEN